MRYKHKRILQNIFYKHIMIDKIMSKSDID